MFFLLRSAVCIGLVASALPPVAGGVPDLARSAVSATPGVLAQFCRANPQRCLDAARSAMEAPRTEAAPIRRLRSTPGPARA